MINLLKIFFPNTIADKPIDGGSIGNNTDTKDTAFSPNSSPSNEINSPVLASDVVGMSMNTQARQILGGYTFGQVGSLAVGKYVAGVSGDIRISPSGIVGRNTSGTNTFTIDGTTGSATFLGTVTATAGSIGGFTIASGYLYAGTGATTAGLSPADYPFWAGATYSNRATAPFRVTPAGAITATSATITGALTTGSGSSLNADYLTAGTITVGGTNSPTALLIMEGALTGNARLGFENGSRMWEDSSARLGINSIGDPMYIYVNSTQSLLLSGDGDGNHPCIVGKETDNECGLYVWGDITVHGDVHADNIA